MSYHAQGVAYKVVWENPMHGSCIGNSYRRKAYLPGGGSRDPRVLKTVACVKATRKWGNEKSFGLPSVPGIYVLASDAFSLQRL